MVDSNTEKPNPRILNENTVYSLSKCKQIIKDSIHERNSKTTWKLKSIWIDDIKNPVIMYDGDPRD